jgi:hypothetical protein
MRLPFETLRAGTSTAATRGMSTGGSTASVTRSFLALLMLVALSVRPLLAQAPRSAGAELENALLPGTTAWITDASGHEYKTRIINVSGPIVTVAAGRGTRSLSSADVRRVRVRRSDSLINGALIGAGSAVASGLGLCSLTESWENCRDDGGSIAAIAALGAGIGVAIDALLRDRRTIYEAGTSSRELRIGPMLAPHARGLQIAVRF